MGLLIFLLLLTILCVVLDDGRAWDNVTRSVRNDLVFEGRHQGYGAYVIRRDYDRRFVIALFTGIGVLGALIGLAYLLGGLHTPVPPPPPAPGPVIDRTMTILPPAGQIDVPASTPEAPRPKPAASSSPSGFVEAGVVDTATKVVPEPEPSGGIGDPDPGPGTPNPGGGDTGGGVEGGGGTAGGAGLDADTLETWGVDHAPSFPGGEAGMFRWVQDHVRFPDRDRAGKRTVYVRFVVDRDGRVADVRAVRGGPAEFAREAERLVASMPVWTPARFKDKDVPCRLVLPISFEVR